MSLRKITCYVVSCDDCRTEFDSGAGDYIVHFDTPDDAEHYVTAEAGWIILADGRHLCGPCWASYACATFGHVYSPWCPCNCKGAIAGHDITGCGLFRYCIRQGCGHEEEATLADLPTIDEPRRSR
jgi:hypothetical protein